MSDQPDACAQLHRDGRLHDGVHAGIWLASPPRASACCCARGAEHVAIPREIVALRQRGHDASIIGHPHPQLWTGLGGHCTSDRVQVELGTISTFLTDVDDDAAVQQAKVDFVNRMFGRAWEEKPASTHDRSTLNVSALDTAVDAIRRLQACKAEPDREPHQSGAQGGASFRRDRRSRQLPESRPVL